MTYQKYYFTSMGNLYVTIDCVQGAHHEAESLDAQCKMAYGSGAEFDGEMCDCRPGFKNVDGRCIPIEKPKRKARAPTKVGAMQNLVLISYLRDSECTASSPFILTSDCCLLDL
jgi:hypothetical protein